MRNTFSLAQRFFPLVLLFCCMSASGQAPTLSNMLYNKRPEISSPNAAAIEKYVEFPTATHTGAPDISVPIYSLGIKGISLPIGLSYHAGGIKVDEVSSDVGAGWSLTAGGAVTILANGILDEVSGYPDMGVGTYEKIKNNALQSGYGGGIISCATAIMYSDPQNPADVYGLYSGGDIALLGGVMNGTHDTEPDVYSFQLPGKSGKFFIDETSVFRTIPYSEIKIERVMSGSFPGGYKIIDEMGNLFEFRIKEESTEMQVNAASSMNPSQRTGRTYYLSKITNVYGETIDFYYSTYTATYDLQKTFTRSRTSYGTECWQMNSAGSYFNTGWTYGTMTTVGQRLDSIKVSDGSMVILGYSATNRTDLPGTKSLAKIELWRYFGERKKIRETVLAQSYSGGRLILNSVTETGKPPTTFTYYGDLPVRLSFAQDHFGYHNALGGTTLLPKDEYNGFPDGGDRSVNPIAAMAGILTQVNHPTGGRTEYEYESNDFYVSEIYYRKEKVAAAYTFSRPDQTASVNFEVPNGAENIFLDYTNSYDGSQMHNDYCIIHLTGPNNYSQDFLGNTQPNAPFLNLSPGVYTLSIENVGSTYSAVATVTWFQNVAVLPHHEPGGGLRIKEIRMYDAGNNIALQKRYEYKKSGTDISSGVISTYPSYITYTNPTFFKQVQSGQTTCSSVSCQLITQSSNPISPIFFANGSSVMYKEVVTYSRNKQQDGYSYFKFNISDVGFNMNGGGFPYAPRIPYDWVNGTLLEQKDYAFVNNQYVPVRTVVNEYNYTDFDPFVNTEQLYSGYGVKVGIADAPSICWSACQGSVIGTTISSIYFGLHRYQLYSSWYKMVRSQETIYSMDGTQPYTKTTSVFYDNPNSIQASRIERANSNGKTLIQRAKYPRDYSNYGFPGYLVSKNVLSAPLEKYDLVKDAANAQFVTGGEIITFKPNSVLPDKSYKYETHMPVAVGSFTPSSVNSSGVFSMDSKYKEQLSFNSYNSIGNVSELQKKNDVVESYLWSYGDIQPVAKAINAKQNEIFYDGIEMAAGWGSSVVYDNSRSHTGAVSGKIVKATAGELIVYSSAWLNITLGAPKKFRYSAWVYSEGPTADVHLIMKTAGGVTSYDNVSTAVTNKWVLVEKEFSVPANITQLNIRVDNNGGGNIWFDDIRLYPSDAQMTTYTYDPLIGITSQTDINNRSVYYEYDVLGRLYLVRDEDKNILKKICYNYAGQSQDCGISLTPQWTNTGVTRCQPCPSNSNYFTGLQERQEKDNNPYSSTYNQIRWVVNGAHASCAIVPDWQNTSTGIRCRIVADLRTGEREQEQQDMNPCSNQGTRWVIVDMNCTVCALPEAWQLTGNTRCAVDGNGNYTGYQQAEARNTQTCSPTYNQLQWINSTLNCTSCPRPANWQPTGNYRCVKDGSNNNTGEQEREERNMESCSATYNQTRWVSSGYHPEVCPPPCSTSNCSGKCINGVCDPGTVIVTSAMRERIDGIWYWRCYKARCYSDGTYDDLGDELSLTSCLSQVVVCQP